MHLQVPGFALARDQIASIAIGAYCAECGGATRDRVADGRAKRRIVAGAMARTRPHRQEDVVVEGQCRGVQNVIRS
jgi:hypothetical protein